MKARKRSVQRDELDLDITSGVIRSCTGENRAYVPLETAQGVVTSLRDWMVNMLGDRPSFKKFDIIGESLETASERVDDQDLEDDILAAREAILNPRISTNDAVTLLNGLRRKIRDKQADVMFDCMILRGF